METSRFAYDAVAYPSRAQSHTHPERLAALALAYGLECTPVSTARILEIGCGDASHLMAIAAAFPGSHCTGLDLSGDAIRRGQGFKRETGLENIELRIADVSLPGIVQGSFDYILCHGLYAWVPKGAREGILRLCRDHLAPDGLALVSYNALPGACVRRELREMLRWHVRGLDSTEDRLVESRALVEFLEAATLDNDEIREAFRAELLSAKKKAPGFFFHDEMSEHYAPVYFHEFMSEASRHDLQFVGDADPAEMLLSSLPAETRQIIQALATDRVEQQQYFDFIVSRRFRHTILCRTGRSVADELQIDGLQRCWFSSLARVAHPDTLRDPNAVTVFESSGGLRLQTDFLPGKLALAALAACGPRRLSFIALARHVEETLTSLGHGPIWTAETATSVVRFLIEACTARVATIHGAVPDVTEHPGERPVAFSVARVQASTGDVVTSAYHHNIRLEERWTRELLLRADGTRTRSELQSELDVLARSANATDAAAWIALRDNLPEAFAHLARQGLIIR